MTLLLTLLFKSLLVFAAAGLLLLTLRRSSAAARHLVCLLTLGAVLLLPLCSLTLPGWHLPVLAARQNMEERTPHQEPTPPRPSATLPKREGEESGQETHQASSPVSAASYSESSLTGRTPAKQGGGFLTQGGGFLTQGGGFLTQGGGFLLYFLGLLLASARPLLGLWGIRRLSRHCADITASPTRTTAADCAQTLGLQPPRLCRADVPVPMTWGWRRPVVVLPLASEGWPDARLRSVLLHEMAHVKRRDWPGHRFADFACAVLWFHPLVWLTARRLRAESELACDDLVLASGIPAPDYARHLLEIASALPRVSSRSHAAIAMAQTSQIESRLHMILDKTRPRHIVARRVLIFALIPGTAALVTLAVLRPDAKAQLAPSIATASPSAVTSSPSTLLFLWPSASTVRSSFNTGPGTTLITHPDLMTAITLTGKGTTLLAGVSDASKPSSQWWDAHGTPLSKSAFKPDTASAMQPLPNEMIRQIAFRLPPSAQGVTLQYKLLQSNGYSSDGAWPGKSQSDGKLNEAQVFATSGGARIVTAQFPASLSKADIQVGVASGLWKVAASAAATTSMASNLRSSGFVIGHALETKDGLSLTVSTDTTDDVRVVAVDLQGHEILPNSIGGSSINKLDQITAQFNLPLSQIKEFCVETRPFQWIEYKDVALKPVQ